VINKIRPPRHFLAVALRISLLVLVGVDEKTARIFLANKIISTQKQELGVIIFYIKIVLSCSNTQDENTTQYRIPKQRKPRFGFSGSKDNRMGFVPLLSLINGGAGTSTGSTKYSSSRGLLVVPEHSTSDRYWYVRSPALVRA
jgi:hypothetical protein